MKTEMSNTTATINLITEMSGPFLPDLVAQDPVSVVLPTIDELVPFGKGNLEVIRRRYRQQEREIIRLLCDDNSAYSFLGLINADDLQHYISMREISTHSKQELEKWKSVDGKHVKMCSWKARGDKDLRCAYGKCIAAYCPVNPEAAHGCESLNTQADKKAFGADIWRKDFPFADTPCVLTSDETIAEYREAILGHVIELHEKLKLVRVYTKYLTKAIELTEEKPLFATFRGTDGWVNPNDMVVLLKPTNDWDDPTLQFTEKRVTKAHFDEAVMGIFYMENLVTVTSDSSEELYPIRQPNLLRKDELKYLRKHKDYLELWLDWSLLMARKDEIASVKAAIRRALA